MRINKKILQKKLASLSLPSVFNNQKTKIQLTNYLNEKLNEKEQSIGQNGELNEQQFKKDIDAKKIFLPHKKVFIDELIRLKLLELIQFNESLYSLQNFDEKLVKEKSDFPIGLVNRKTNLTKCISENFFDFNGNKTEFSKLLLEKFNSKEQKIVINEQETKQFFDYLIKIDCLVKTNKYKICKDTIFKKSNQNKKKNDDENKTFYEFYTLYDLQRNYTNEFKDMEESFRNCFLKAAVYEKAVTENDVEHDDEQSQKTAVITLKDSVFENEFQISKTHDEAVTMLWNFLQANLFFKNPKINISLCSSEEVKKKREEIKEYVKNFLKENNQLSSKSLDEALDSCFSLIDETIGELKKLPDDACIAQFLNIKTSYFFEKGSQAPESLQEFIELAMDVVFTLQEKKDPPKWYQIAGVIVLGIIQVVAGCLAKTFIPFAGQLIGEFLISTGCDDISFGIQSAISGEFSWQKVSKKF
jgi:hypothetical protein